jgi:hypothetical protein
VDLEGFEEDGYNYDEGIFPIARIVNIWRDAEEVRVAWLYPESVFPEIPFKAQINWDRNERIESNHYQLLKFDNLTGHARVCTNCRGCESCIQEDIPHWYRRLQWDKTGLKPRLIGSKKVKHTA